MNIEITTFQKNIYEMNNYTVNTPLSSISPYFKKNISHQN
jgi:hypothetical protein